MASWPPSHSYLVPQFPCHKVDNIQLYRLHLYAVVLPFTFRGPRRPKLVPAWQIHGLQGWSGRIRIVCKEPCPRPFWTFPHRMSVPDPTDVLVAGQIPKTMLQNVVLNLPRRFKIEEWINLAWGVQQADMLTCYILVTYHIWRYSVHHREAEHSEESTTCLSFVPSGSPIVC